MLDGWLDLAAFTARRSTPIERLVIVWLLILGSTGIGVVCLYLGLTAPSAHADEAAALRLYAYGFLAFAAVVWVLHRLVAWLLDR